MPCKIRLRESLYILEESDDTYQVIFTSTRKIKRFQVDPLVKDIIAKTRQEIDKDRVISSLSRKYPSIDISLCINSLVEEGILREASDKSFKGMYARQVAFIEELTCSDRQAINLQKKLGDSVVSVFGTGGIGTWVVNGLNQIGIGEIRITDPDTVHLTNLNRQLFFRVGDIGRYKVDVLKERLGSTNIKAYQRKVSANENLEDIVKGSDFMVNCADSPSVADTSRIIAGYANRYNIPYCIAGGYNMHLGMVGPIIIPGGTACFDCFLEYQKENDQVSQLKKIKDIEQTGNLGPIAGAVANIQVMEIFKHLIGQGRTNINRFAEIDFMDFNVEWRHFPKREGCKTCNTKEF